MRVLFVLLISVTWCTSIGCDTVVPVDESQLVVEGFLDSGGQLPAIQVSRTLAPRQPYNRQVASVDDARVTLHLGGSLIEYSVHRDGEYVASVPALRVRPGDPFRLEVAWSQTVARASGIVPPEIHIRDISVDVPAEPVSAVLLDSLALSDSLATGAYTGYIYPIEVMIVWNESQLEGWMTEDSWVRTQLKPFAGISSPVVDLFLRSEEITRESTLPRADGGRAWTGIYAVGVAAADDPLPDHQLRVSLVRSDAQYASYAASRDAPDRREPISNFEGGIGIFAAVSVDSLHVHVGPGGVRQPLVSRP